MMSQAFKITDTLRSVAKLLLQSRSCHLDSGLHVDNLLIIMGNGPSFRDVIEHHLDALRCCDTMAVNFAANTVEFFSIKPRYYTIADPHFYQSLDDANVVRLIDNLRRVDWPMTLFVPSCHKEIAKLISNDNITLSHYNAIGVEGWRWLTHFAFNHKLAMPRPRNVLIPSIMIGVWLGYKNIYIAGADHSWTQSLSVDDENRVVTNLSHYYKDNEHEQSRVKAVYANIPIHALFLSYHIAFKAYHEIQDWALRRGVNIYNVTPGSFIDAFPRKNIAEILLQ